MIVKYIGLTAETSALIERFRTNPAQAEDEIISVIFQLLISDQRSAGQAGANLGAQQGCDLGKGVVLDEGEAMFCYRFRHSFKARKPEESQLQGGAASISTDKG